MRVSRAKLITALAGLGALAVVLTCAAFWREIVRAVYPEARLWGRWGLVEETEGERIISIFEPDKFVLEFSYLNRVKTGIISDSGAVFEELAIWVDIPPGGLSIPQPSAFYYQLQGDIVQILDESCKQLDHFYFDGTYIRAFDEESGGDQLKFRRLPPED